MGEVSPGVLGDTYLRRLIDEQFIVSAVNLSDNVKESAIDLPLSTDAWVLTNGERPTPRSLARIITRANERLPLEDECFEFEAGKIYLVRLDVNLRLPDNINGRATGKSSVGRLDVITRLVTSDRMRESM